MEPIKKQFLELLDKDPEFRYAVAGYLGLSEILKRLDNLSEEQVKLREEQTKIWHEIQALREEQIKLREEQTRIWQEIAKLREEQTKTWQEIKILREEQIKFREEQTKIWKEVAGLREEQTKIWKEIQGLREEQISLRKEQTKTWKEIQGIREEQTKIWREIGALREEQTKIWNEIQSLREDFNMMLKEIRSIDTRLGRIERTLEKLTVDIEEEARSIIKYRLKKDLGLNIEINSLTLPELELNIYGASNDTCIIGEASVRGGTRIIQELTEKIETLKNKYPEKLRKLTIPVIYVCTPLPELIEEAKKKKIWVLKATKDYYKPPLPKTPPQ